MQYGEPQFKRPPFGGLSLFCLERQGQVTKIFYRALRSENLSASSGFCFAKTSLRLLPAAGREAVLVLSTSLGLCLQRQANMSKECFCLLFAFCGSADCDGETEEIFCFFVGRFWEDRVLLETDRDVAHVVDRLC